MKLIKNRKVIFLILVILALGLYWFELRPSNIRKACMQKAIEDSVRLYPPFPDNNTTYEPDTAQRALLQGALQEKEYRNCINEKGLKE